MHPSNINIEYVRLWSNCFNHFTINDETIEIIFKVSKDIIMNIWNSENIEKTIININNNISGYIANYIVNTVNEFYYNYLIFYHDNQITYYGLMTQTLYKAYDVFLSFIMNMISDYTYNKNITLVNKSIFKNIFIEDWCDTSEIINYETLINALKINIINL